MLIVLILEIEALYETIPDRTRKCEVNWTYAFLCRLKTNFIAFKGIEVIHMEPGYISWLLLKVAKSYEREKI